MTVQPGAMTGEARRQRWRMTAWVAGVFTVLVGGAMLVGHLTTGTIDPLKEPALKEAKEKLRMAPTDETTKQRIRALDLELRRRYFRQLTQRNSGVYLLVGGAALFVLSVCRSSGSRKQLPHLLHRQEVDGGLVRFAAGARWSVASLGAVIGGSLFAVAFFATTGLPERPEDLKKLIGSDEPGPSEAANDGAPIEEQKRYWPRFRGFEGGGVSPFTNVPASWDAGTGAGIGWKVPSPAIGFNSPIIWGDKVFFSGGDSKRLEVICLSLKSGEVMWRQAVENVPGSPAQAPEIPDSTGWCAPTMATDGKRVYAIFANGNLAAFTLDGKPAWTKAFGALKNMYGQATSLATWQDRVIVQLDQGENEENRSKLYALDGHTGRIVWQKPRKTGASWASPIVIDAAGKPQIITLAIPLVMSYAAGDGSELWRFDGLNGEITPSPVFAGGKVMVVSPSERMLAIRPDGQGDVSKTHLAWTAEDNMPDVTSPVSNGELAFVVTTSGLLTCFNAQDGKKLWEHDFEMECHASPAIAGNRLYLFTQKGVVVVVDAAATFRELARADMGDSFHASPAFVSGSIVVRGVTNVWRIGLPGVGGGAE